MDNTANIPAGAASTTMLAAIGIIFLVIGMGIGYVVFSSPSAGNTATVINNTIIKYVESGNYTIDESAIKAQIAAFNRINALRGANISLMYQSAKIDDDGLIEALVLDTSSGSTAKVYFSKTNKYISIMDATQQFPIDVVNYSIQMEAAAAASSASTASVTPIPKANKPKMELYVMSFCPYGIQAEQGLYPVIKAMNSTFDFEPVYIISGSAGKWNSLHGTSELNQDIREKIIYNLYGAKVWNEYVHSAHTICSLQNIDACWKNAAQNISVISTSAVEAQYNSSFDTIAIGEAAKSGSNRVSGSPTFILDNLTLGGTSCTSNADCHTGEACVNSQSGLVCAVQRDAESLKNLACSAFLAQPSECNQTLTAAAAASSGSCS